MALPIESIGGEFNETGPSEEIRVASGIVAVSGLSGPSSVKIEFQVRVGDEWFVYAEYTDDQTAVFDFKVQVGVRLVCTEHQLSPLAYGIEGMHVPSGHAI